MWPFKKQPEVPETPLHERALIAKRQFFRLAKKSPEEAVFHLGMLPATVGHKAMMLILAELASKVEK